MRNGLPILLICVICLYGVVFLAIAIEVLQGY
jgi:hypothetical protein